MSGKIGDQLLKLLEEVRKEDPERAIRVIVTTAAGTDPTALEQKGLKIDHIFDSISAVSGTLTAAEIHELAQLDQVEVIEYDGPVRALSNSVKGATTSDRS
jgi:hypothetical protein